MIKAIRPEYLDEKIEMLKQIKYSLEENLDSLEQTYAQLSEIEHFYIMANKYQSHKQELIKLIEYIYESIKFLESLKVSMQEMDMCAASLFQPLGEQILCQEKSESNSKENNAIAERRQALAEALRKGEPVTVSNSGEIERKEYVKPPILPNVQVPNGKLAGAPCTASIPQCNLSKKTENKKEGFFKRVKKSLNKEKNTYDDVQFRAAASDGIHKGTYTELKILMYNKGDYEEADRIVSRMGDKTKESSSGIFSIARGRQLRIVIQSPDIQIEDDIAEILWNGKLAQCSFELFVPENYEGKQVRIKGRVYDGQAVLTDLKLILNIDNDNGQDVIAEQCKLCSAFVSYASQDRSKVIARIQGIQAARKDLDIFVDVEKLRCGENWQPRLFYEIENRSIFYLFWSVNAKNSKWVKQELAHAIKTNGIDSIEPIPLEPPEICSPPDELACKHFNDWTLRYLEK